MKHACTKKVAVERYCSTCYTSELDLSKNKKSSRKKLLKCTGCNLTRYCSKQCQKKHDALHQPFCKRIGSLQETVRVEELALSSYNTTRTTATTHGQRGSHTKKENVFETKAGSFGNLGYCSSYNHESHKLANETFRLAYTSCDTPKRGGELYQLALDCFMEILRLNSPCYRDGSLVEQQQPNTNLWNKIIVLLVALEREDDALSMIEYFSTFGLDQTWHAKLAQSSRPGDWIYPRCCSRYERVAHVGYYDNDNTCSRSRSRSGTVLGGEDMPGPQRTATLMVCLFLIKIRILAKYKLDTTNWIYFEQTTGGVHLEQVHSIIQDFLFLDKKCILQQEQDIEILLALVNEEENCIITLLQDGVPLPPDEAELLFDPDTPHEFWYLLQDCFVLSPGVADVIHQYLPWTK